MLVKQTIYVLSLLIFIFSIFTMIYSIKNKNREVCKYIIVLSIVYIIYSCFDLCFLPYILNLSIGFEMLIFYAVLVITIILFIISIIMTVIKSKKLKNICNTKKHIIFFTFLVIFPIVIFVFSYFREINYINNSKLILVCSDGDGFSEENFAYAISDNYSKKITIGSDFRGYAMKKHLPNSFYALDYTWVTDKIEIENDKIMIYRNNKIIYKMNLASQISHCNIEEVFYKQK